MPDVSRAEHGTRNSNGHGKFRPVPETLDEISSTGFGDPHDDSGFENGKFEGEKMPRSRGVQRGLLFEPIA
jgi:hypothetical protein